MPSPFLRVGGRRWFGAETGAVRSARRALREVRLGGELLAHELADDAGVRLPLRLLHHLTDEEAEEAVLAVAIRLNLAGARREDGVDDRLQLAAVRDGLLREIRVGREARLAELRDRFVEGRAWDPVARGEELRELVRGDVSGLHARTDEDVRDDVRRPDGVYSLADRVLPEPVEPAGDEDGGPLDVQLLGDPSDPCARRLGELRLQPIDEPGRRLDRDE